MSGRTVEMAKGEALERSRATLAALERAAHALELIAEAQLSLAASAEAQVLLAQYPVVADRPKYGPHTPAPPLEDFPPADPDRVGLHLVNGQTTKSPP